MSSSNKLRTHLKLLSNSQFNKIEADSVFIKISKISHQLWNIDQIRKIRNLKQQEFYKNSKVSNY